MNQAEHKFDSARLKLFVKHLALASKRQEETCVKKEEIKQHVSNLKKAVSKKTPKKQVNQTINNLEESLSSILNTEKQILSSQTKETFELKELKTQVKELNNKLVALGREYAETLADHEEENIRLKQDLANAHLTIEEHKQEKKERLKKISAVEEKIKKQENFKKKQAITEVKSRLKELEDTHKRISKSGEHKKTDLNRLKKIITSHKKTLSNLNKK